MITVHKLLMILNERGFKEINRHGNYHKFSNAKGQVIIFSYLNHNDIIPKGTYKAIFKQIN